jgi:uncharacterized GH25 family protein
MKKILFSMCLCLCALLWGAKAQAHFLWIETSPEGRIGQAQEIRIYYGEYMDNQREIIGQRFDEVKDFSSWIISPAGKKIPLELKEAKDHYTASFTPAEQGIYTIALENMQREVVDWQKYDIGIIRATYYATSTVTVGAIGTAKAEPGVNAFNIFTAQQSKKVNAPVQLTVNFNKLQSKKQKLMVYAPNGWAKEVETNEKGEAVFTPLWDGMYLVEAIYSEKNPGNFKGKDYESIRHRAILTIYVSK